MVSALNGRQVCEQLFADLQNERQSWEAAWRSIADYMLPQRARWVATDRNDGRRKDQKILNNTAGLALRVLASGLMSGMTSPAREWFRLTHPDPEALQYGGVRYWLSEAEARMRSAFARTNLYQALPQLYREVGAFGTGVMWSLDDDDRLLRYQTLTAGEYYLMADAHDRIEGLGREFELTVRQAAQRFGADMLSEQARTALQNHHSNAKVIIRHLVVPADFDLPDLPPPLKTHRYRSIYWEVGGRHDQWLRIAGFKRQPFFAVRWDLRPGDVYGFGPGHEAIGDAKQLQLAETRKAEAISKMVRPPLKGPGALAKTGQKADTPGGITYIDEPGGSDSFGPVYQVQPRLNELLMDIDKLERRIQQTFYADLFMMMANSDRRQITAREIEERHEEKMLMLGSTYQRMLDELLRPLVDTMFDRMVEEEVLPDPPMELEGVELRVEFSSMMEEAQKMVQTGAVQRFLEFVLMSAQAAPQLTKKVDWLETADAVADMLSIPPKMLRESKAVQADQAQEAQQMQAAQGLGMAQQAAAAARDVGGLPGAGGAPLAQQIAEAVAG